MLGLLAFIIPIGIGLVTNMLLLKYSLVTSVLLASMYASHTLVAYPIVIRYGVSRHRSVSIAVGDSGDRYAYLVGTGCGGRSVQRRVRRIILVMAGDKGGVSWSFDHVFVSAYRTLVLPSLR